MPDQMRMSDARWQHRSCLGDRQPRLSVIGLGKLGAPMAAVFGSAGFGVTGYDLKAAAVDAVAAGEAPCSETDLDTYIASAGTRLTATHDIKEAIAQSDISFVVVPTPSMENGLFDNRYILEAVEAIGKAIACKDGYHLVVITSTVVPGSCRGAISDRLTATAQRPLGATLGLCYSPEFIALGSVIRDMLHPDMILIGQSDEEAGTLLELVYRHTCRNTPHYHRMSFENAELAKIAVNTFVTTKISYANMLSAMCDKLPGSDIDVISRALGSDSRIGPKYLKGGTAYGGPCFPRDNKMFSALAQRLSVPAEIAVATDRTNSYQGERLLAFLRAGLPDGARVAILGLTYKTDTDVTEESAGRRMLASLAGSGDYHAVVHDPAAAVTNDAVEVADTVSAALENADAAIVMTTWQDYEALPALLADRARPLLLVDPWRLFAPGDFPPAVDYIALGRPSQPEKS